MKDPFKIFQNFLRASLPNFAEMEKQKEIPMEHIELIFKLLMLFPCLETFHFEWKKNAKIMNGKKLKSFLINNISSCN